MIRTEPVSKTPSHRQIVIRRAPARQSWWSRVAAEWTRQWTMTRLEYETQNEVRRRVARKRPEPGDVVMVNMIVDEMMYRNLG